jgi:hypothetical protein
MRKRIKADKSNFVGIKLHEALDVTLGFKLCSYDPDLVLKHPETFEYGKSEYDHLLDNLITAPPPLCPGSKNSVIGRDSIFLQVLKSLGDCKVALNQSVHSSGFNYHDFTVSVRGSLVLMGAENADEEDEDEAIALLLGSINLELFGGALPKGHSCVPAFTTTNDKIIIHSVQYNDDKTSLTSTELRNYLYRIPEERLRFVKDLFRLACWFSALPPPTLSGTLLPCELESSCLYSHFICH